MEEAGQKKSACNGRKWVVFYSWQWWCRSCLIVYLWWINNTTFRTWPLLLFYNLKKNYATTLVGHRAAILFNSDLFNCSTLLFYHNRIHNSIKFCLNSLCLILCIHHLPCPFPLLGADRPRFSVADVWLWKGIDLPYLILSMLGGCWK